MKTRNLHFPCGSSGWCFLALSVSLGGSLLGMGIHGPRDLFVIVRTGSTGKGEHSPELVLVAGGAKHVSGVCRMGLRGAVPHLCHQFISAPAQRLLLCVRRCRHQPWRYPLHFLCYCQVLPAVSRCKMFNWVHFLQVCWWSVSLILVVWHQTRMALLCGTAPQCLLALWLL